MEKNDLVAMNSELQLKADQDSQDDSFIEVIRVTVKISTNSAKLLKHNKSCSDSVVLKGEATCLNAKYLDSLSGWRRRQRERRLWVGAQQTSGSQHDVVTAGERGSDGQPSPPVSEERDTAGRAAADSVAVGLCQVRTRRTTQELLRFERL